MLLIIGIIDNEADSLFTYGQEESWQKFYSPNFIPMFRPTFTDPELEEEAKRLCGKDQFCLFDIAATKRVDIGLATLNGGQNLNRIMNLSAPSKSCISIFTIMIFNMSIMLLYYSLTC